MDKCLKCLDEKANKDFSVVKSDIRFYILEAIRAVSVVEKDCPEKIYDALFSLAKVAASLDKSLVSISKNILPKGNLNEVAYKCASINTVYFLSEEDRQIIEAGLVGSLVSLDIADDIDLCSIICGEGCTCVDVEDVLLKDAETIDTPTNIIENVVNVVTDVQIDEMIDELVDEIILEDEDKVEDEIPM